MRDVTSQNLEKKLKEVIRSYYKCSNTKAHSFYVELVDFFGLKHKSNKSDFERLVISKLENKRLIEERNREYEMMSELGIEIDRLSEIIVDLELQRENNDNPSTSEEKELKKDKFYTDIKTQWNTERKRLKSEIKKLKKVNEQLICRKLQLEGSVQKT